MAVKNKETMVKIIVDTREQDVSFVEKIKFDKEFDDSKIKICDVEVVTCKPLGCSTSTGDITIEISHDEGITWEKTKLCIELKKDRDFVTTLFSNWIRFKKELERAKEANLDFYILYNQTGDDIENCFKEWKYKNVTNRFTAHNLIYDRMLSISTEYHVPLIHCGSIAVAIRRIIKHHIKKNKLNKER